METIKAILGVFFFIGLGYILGYTQKQKDEYDRGYFFGHADGVEEQRKLQNEDSSLN